MVNYLKSKILSAKIRKAAENLKSSKEEVSNHVVNKMIKSCEDNKLGLTTLLLVYQGCADAIGLITRFLTVIATDTDVQSQLKVFLANVIGDFAARLNEFANMTDKITTHPEIFDAIKRVDETISRVKELEKTELFKTRAQSLKADILESCKKGKVTWCYSLEFTPDDVLDVVQNDPEIPEVIRTMFPELRAEAKRRAAVAEAQRDKTKAEAAEAKVKAKEATTDELQKSLLKSLNDFLKPY